MRQTYASDEHIFNANLSRQDEGKFRKLTVPRPIGGRQDIGPCIAGEMCKFSPRVYLSAFDEVKISRPVSRLSTTCHGRRLPAAASPRCMQNRPFRAVDIDCRRGYAQPVSGH
jgi:hypothetical protein